MTDNIIPARRGGIDGWLDVATGRFAPRLAGADPIVDLPTANGKLGDELKAIEAKMSEARDRRAAAVRERDQAKKAFAGLFERRGDAAADSQEFAAARDAVKALGQIDDEITRLQHLQVGVLQMIGKGGDDAPVGTYTSNAAPSFGFAGSWKTANVLADGAVREKLQRVGGSSVPVGNMPLGEVVSAKALADGLGTRGKFAATIGGTTDMRRGDYQGIVSQLRRRLRVLDLIPTGTMDRNTYPFTQESGSFTGAAETAEGSLKPEGALSLTDAEAFAQTIAVWNKIQKQSLADFPALQATIDTRLRYEVLQRLENQILAGSGTGSNLTGILNTSGLASVAFTAGALVADQALEGITTVLLAYGEADAIILHPTDWKHALIAKAAGDGHYFSGGPYSTTPEQMWGVPLIPSPAITQGTALVGDFSIGAQLLIREGVQVLLSDSDQDDFLRNVVTLLAEMRAALAVFRPSVFATVALQ